MTNIILCGGSGTRLWPLSRTLMPKQFVKLFEGESLFQKTVQRNQKACDAQFIVSNAEQYFLAVDQIEDMSIPNYQAKYLLEPVGRNTAPAIALACFALDPEEIVLVTPSEHLIKDEKAYLEAVSKAKNMAASNNLVTFGIMPQYPETGFGYIEAETQDESATGYELRATNDGLDVVAFKEKPDLQTAEGYLSENVALNTQHLALKYYWNSGMFCFKAGVFLDELRTHSPRIYGESLIAYNRANEGEMIRISHDDMMAIPEDSIDYAVMEKSDKVKVIPSDIDWSDLGSFESLDEEIKSSDNVINIDSSNNLILSSKQVAAIDVDDLIIIDTADALLISKKGSSQKVKEVVKQLKEKDSELPHVHVTGNRPWGTYTVLEDSDGYKIKRIEVKPGGRLSLQRHKHRNEHWVVVSGMATVTINDDVFTLKQNESTYIKAGDIHRLENATNEPLLIIEAQVGSYTGEDDIERLEDDYKRNEVNV